MSDKIQRDAQYEYGVVTRETEDNNAFDAPRYARNQDWPKVQHGTYFIDKLGVTTWREYLEKNPEAINTKRVMHFFKVDSDGSRNRVAHGTLSEPQTVTGLNDDAEQPAVHTPFLTNSAWPEVSSAKQKIIDLQAQNNDLRLYAESKEHTIRRLETDINTLREKMMDLERNSIQALADLDVEKRSNAATIEALRTEHAHRMEYQEKRHANEIELLKANLKREAIDEYVAAAGLGDPSDEDKALRMMQGIGDMMEKAAPIIEIFKPLLQAGISKVGSKIGVPPSVPPAAIPPNVHPLEPPTPPAPAPQPDASIYGMDGQPLPGIV